MQGSADILSAPEHVLVATSFERAVRPSVLGSFLDSLDRRGGRYATNQAVGWEYVSSPARRNGP